MYNVDLSIWVIIVKKCFTSIVFFFYKIYQYYGIYNTAINVLWRFLFLSNFDLKIELKYILKSIKLQHSISFPYEHAFYPSTPLLF